MEYDKSKKPVSYTHLYCMAPIVATQPSWFYVMVVVTVLLLTELKHTFTEFAQRMKNEMCIRDSNSYLL